MLLRKYIAKLLHPLKNEFHTHNRIEVSESAIRDNLNLFKNLSGQNVIPVLKGNAYGHGIRQVAQALRGADIRYIAVDGYFEALRVREVNKCPVLVMGAIKPNNFKRMKYKDFAFVVQDEASIRALGETGERINLHLEINTGMNRYGVLTDEVEGLVRLALSYKNLRLEGVMSHLADADGEDPDNISRAVECFDLCVELVRQTGANPKFLHIANTAGSVTTKSKYANATRLGIGLYGINPFRHDHKAHNLLKDLRPAMRLVSTITKVVQLSKGDKVSYNYTFTAPKPMTIGVLPLGYYEGVNRALSNKGVIKIGSEFTPIVGRVCMNHTIISLGDIDARVGDEVVVYSNDPKDPNAIDNIAAQHDLFNYTLLTGLSHDVRRVLVD